MELWAWASFSVVYIVELQVLNRPARFGWHALRSREANKAALSPSTRALGLQQVNWTSPRSNKMFSRFASAARRAGRHARQLSTAAAGDGSGFLIAGGVGVAAIACMAPRADEGHGSAAPALPADEASKKLLAVLSHGEELAKIAKVKATMPDNIAIQKFGTAPCGNQPERNRSLRGKTSRRWRPKFDSPHRL